MTIEELAVKIQDIEKRNQRVEADKAWETSWTRKAIVFILTYFVIVVFFMFANLSKPFVNAIVPAIAFLLSTLTVPLFKRWWSDRMYKKRT